MYKKFKDCLLKPSRIGFYLEEKFSRTIIYFLLLLLIYSLPTITSLYSIKEMPQEYSNVIIEKFNGHEEITYKIENGKLISTIDNPKPQYVNLGNMNSVNADIITLFNLTDDFDITKFNFDSSLVGKNVLIITFRSEKLLVNMGQVYEGNNSDEVELLSSTENASTIEFTYEELGAINIDFTKARYNKTAFKKELDDLYYDIFQKNKAVILASSISFSIMANAISMILEILILALLIKVLYSRFAVKYSKICQIVLLAYTPQVVFNLLSIFWSSIFMYLLGQFLTIIYITIAIRYYSLNNIVKNIGSSIASIIEQNRNEQGDNDNEL